MTARAAAVPARVTVGDPIRVTVSIDAPPRSTVRLRNPASTAELSRVAVSPWTARREGAGWRLERVETWTAFAPGASTPLRYSYAVHSPGAADASGEFATAPVAVASVLPGGTAAPPAAPLRPPVTRAFVPWQLAAALALGAAVTILFAALLRRRRALPSRVRNADEIFDGELDLLESSLARSAPEDTFYDWLAEITRWYLEQKLAIPATRLTSDEIGARLRETEGGRAAVRDAAAVFAVCDGIRFARREHRLDRAHAAIASARRAAAAIREKESAEPERRSA